ncbi:hypothetical protein GCM10009078_40430 [Cupriavidus gilardii]
MSAPVPLCPPAASHRAGDGSESGGGNTARAVGATRVSGPQQIGTGRAAAAERAAAAIPQIEPEQGPRRPGMLVATVPKEPGSTLQPRESAPPCVTLQHA